MNYALYQYINRDGVVSHALVNTETRAIMLADLISYTSLYENKLVWNNAAYPEYVWQAIQNDKHHKVVATATHPDFLKVRG
ncbi:hypothetical protein [Escherichia phage SKA49]|uniref:Uncharacterized protein n=1 Tax=Escherichia phage SKA49 TaxID=2910155 RepID=A0A9E7C5X3_9CAUD|nr:hypothetical protein QNH01_gp03 [Escherichia phage SKA49]UIU47091.1 hypothetical protein [Escherichia phage SKA49]